MSLIFYTFTKSSKMIEDVFRGKLVLSRRDFANYITHVFKDLRKKDKYIMCTEFPRWDINANVGDVGFVKVRFVKQGEDTWFDGEKYIPYKKTDIHLMEFIPEKKESEKIKIKL